MMMMKTTILTIAALTAAVLAQPHGRRHHHHRRHIIVETDVITATDVVTAVVPTATVFVDNNGNPVSTALDSSSTAGASAEPVSAANVPSSPSSASSRLTYVGPLQPEPTTTAPAASSSTPSVQPETLALTSSTSIVSSTSAVSAGPASPSASSSAGSSGLGLAYSPYNGDGTCKAQVDVDKDFASISDYSLVRIYGTDCNQTAMVLSAASAKSMKVFAGVYDISQLASEVPLIVAAVQHNWAAIDTVSVGNEGVNDGRYSADQAVAAVNTARSMLRAAGYTGPVVTVDTFIAVEQHPELCAASDYAAANCHAFFDGSQTAAQTGEWTLAQAQRVQQACGGKKTVITEAGWPWRGAANGAAVPSVADQATAVASLKQSFTSNLILYTAFDDLWKVANMNTFDAEPFWGLLSHDT